MGNSKTSTFIEHLSTYADAAFKYVKEESERIRESKTSVIKDTFGCGCVIERTYWESHGEITRRKFEHLKECSNTTCDRADVCLKLHAEYGK